MKAKFLKHFLPLVLSLIIGGSVAVIAGQDQNWDLLNYHYYNAYSLIHDREHKDIAVAGIQTYENPVADVLPYALFSNFKPVVGAALLGALQGLNLWLVYEIALLLLKKIIKDGGAYWLALLIATVSFFGSGNLGEIGNTMADNTTGLLVLGGLTTFLLSVQSKRTSKQRLYLQISSFALLGLATGLKLTNAIFSVGLLLAELANYRDGFKRIVKNGFVDISSLVVGFLIADGAWAYFLWKSYKSPLFPFYNGLLRSPYYSNTNFVDPRFFPKGFFHWLFYPFYFASTQTLVAEEPFRDPRLAILYGSVIVFVIFSVLKRFSKNGKPAAIKIPKELLVLLIFVVVSYVLWEKEFSIYRYLVVIELLALPATAGVILSIWKARIHSIVLIFALLVFSVVWTRPLNWGRIDWQSTMFGVRLPVNYVKNNSAILMAGSDPLGYLVPAFPVSDSMIRVQSTVSPDTGSNTPMQQLIKSKINQLETSGSNFYGIETGQASQAETQTYSIYGFTLKSCKIFHTYEGDLLIKNPGYYRICQLTKS